MPARQTPLGATGLRQSRNGACFQVVQPSCASAALFLPHMPFRVTVFLIPCPPASEVVRMPAYERGRDMQQGGSGDPGWQTPPMHGCRTPAPRKTWFSAPLASPCVFLLWLSFFFLPGFVGTLREVWRSGRVRVSDFNVSPCNQPSFLPFFFHSLFSALFFSSPFSLPGTKTRPQPVARRVLAYGRIGLLRE